ncbi:MAG: Fis family transcriptional regulator, partial [Desulfuromonadales bacterium]|nr:Fis family transcriptional regulator [Desulfuromonadales bacterium]NIS40210.1 Fis family transcriptional regulator [Desulfuromonadales bacterium]
MQLSAQLTKLATRISRYGKENLDDILHLVAEAAQRITRQNRCRIYLEDLTLGQLVCEMTSGRYPRQVFETTFPLNSGEFLVSRAYLSQEEAYISDISS